MCVGSASAAGNQTNRGSACYATALTDVNVDADAAAGFDTLKLAVRRAAFKMSHTPMLRAQSRNGSQSDRPESAVCFCFSFCCDSNSFLDKFVTRIVLPICCVLYFLVLRAVFTSRCPRWEEKREQSKTCKLN